MSNTPEYSYKVSVIVPIYNVSAFLPACLDSLVNQTLDGLEVVMVDDGSTDDSGVIADRYARRHEGFTVVHRENGGLGSARNCGVKNAHGKYITFLDSDDIVPQDIYERMYCRAEAEGSDMAICAVERFNSSREWMSGIHDRAFRNIQSPTHITKNPDLLYDTISCNKLIRRDFWDKHGFAFPTGILYEDIPVTVPMHFLANQVSVVHSVGYLWRERDTASKSITQNASSLKNLTDRLEILKRLKAFFAANVQDGELHILNDVKTLRVDLIIFVKNCIAAEREQSLEMMRLIREYIREYMAPEALERLSLLERRLYDCVLQDDYDGLYRAAVYRTDTIEKGKITERDGRFYLSLPEEIFGAAETDYTDELRVRPAKTYIHEVTADDGNITFRGQLYLPRLNIAMGEQEVKAYLLGEFTGDKTPLALTYTPNTALTSEKGVLFNSRTGEQAQYNYDGTGFEITVSAETLVGADSRACIILLEYKNRLTEGTAVLHGMRAAHLDWMEGLATVHGDVAVRLQAGALRTPLIYAEKALCFLSCFACREDGITLHLDGRAQQVIAKCGHDTLTFDVSADTVNIPASALQDGSEYELFVQTPDGTGHLMRRDKSTDLIHQKGFAMMLRSNKTHTVNLYYAAAFSCLRHPEAEGNILRFGTTNLGALNTDRNRARIVVPDDITKTYTVLASADTRLGEDGRLRANFHLNFDNERITKNLFESRRDVFIEYLKTDKDGNILACDRQKLVSKFHFRKAFETESLALVMYKAMDGGVRLNLTLRWAENADTDDKRQLLINECYPQYRTQPINNRLIVFESMWGNKFSCNPRAIYEYINQNYPEFKCVWALCDEHIPITGRASRVRRGSPEYYRVLATAKYLVNNVNFPDDYVKRKGQVEIQTMHGTPLKTLGFDVKDELATIEERLQFERKTDRWNYLVVQGKFMQDKAYPIYHYRGKILKTGYPRTDELFRDADVQQIRTRLGIPDGKKVILYAPTWRVHNSFDMALDLEKMRAALSDEYVLLIRIHYFASSGYTVPADNQFIFNMNDYAVAEDLYRITDVLITDYSSLMFDFALLGKPMIFFAYDLDSYAGATRGVYFDIRTEAPGAVVYHTEEVIDAVCTANKPSAEIQQRAAAFRQKYLTYECGNSCQKVVAKAMHLGKCKTAALRLKRAVKRNVSRVKWNRNREYT